MAEWWVISANFRMSEQANPPWKAVILFYPPFEPANPKFQHIHPSQYRSFLPLKIPPGLDRQDFDSRESHMDCFLFCLRFRDAISRKDAELDSALSVAKPPPALLESPLALLDDLWRIIASECHVFDTYAERSLNNIEKFFEILGENCDQENLHFLLGQLMKIQRRITKYSALIADALDAWPDDWRSLDRSVHRNYLRNPSPMLDIERILKLLEHKQTRITHAIQVVTSFMGIHQGQLAEKRNESLYILTAVASLLLPFSTVAAIMSIPGDQNLGPNKKHFWKFWVSAMCPLLGSVLFWFVVKEARVKLHPKRHIKLHASLSSKISAKRPVSQGGTVVITQATGHHAGIIDRTSSHELSKWRGSVNTLRHNRRGVPTSVV